MATIESRTGDIFAEDVEAIVNTVNCVGVMGKGLALQFKRRYPQNFDDYVVACNQGRVRPGQVHLHELAPPPQRETAVQGQLSFSNFSRVAEPAATYSAARPRLIINFPTKDHWRRHSRLEYIESGLDDLVRVINEQQIRSIAVPALGCDLGGLNWSEVRPRIERALGAVDNLRVVILEPRNAPILAG